MPTTSPRTRWGVVVLGLAAGVIAAAYIGKVPPALPLMRPELGLGLVAAGWVVLGAFGWRGLWLVGAPAVAAVVAATGQWHVVQWILLGASALSVAFAFAIRAVER